MLRFMTPASLTHFKKVEAFARKRGFSAAYSFYRSMKYLSEYGGEDKYGRGVYEVSIYPDYAPHSFFFEVHQIRPFDHYTPKEAEYFYLNRREMGPKFVFNGGIIYYGPGESGVGDPQYSVRVGGNGEEEWRINT